jgi:hypothetical protein
MKKDRPKQQIQEVMLLDPVKLRVLSEPLRYFVAYSLVPQAKTAKELAAELGCPVTRLYYHLQQLEKHELIFVESTRVVSGIIERHYRACARELLLNRENFRAGDRVDSSRADALLAFVFDQTRQEILRQLETGQLDPLLRAPTPGALIAYRTVLRLSTEQSTRLYQRLYDFWTEYEAIAKAPSPDGQFYAFTVALYPNAVSAPEKPAPTTKEKRK